MDQSWPHQAPLSHHYLPRPHRQDELKQLDLWMQQQSLP